MNAVLGISAYHGAAAAALVVDGRLAAAVAEERFTRVKHWAGFPAESVRACLDMGGLGPADVEHIAIARDPRAHLASAFLVSPWEEAAVCAIDGFGDFVSTSWGIGTGRRLRIDGRVHFPHSLGMFYLALTQYLGFLRYGDEFKVMGLAAYGAPDFAERLR